MNLEWWIAWRYLVTKRKEKFLSLISIIAISGVVVGVAALIVVTAVMSGFSQDLRNKIIGNFAHITISAEGGIENPWAVINQLWPIEEIQGASPFVEGQALVRQEKRIFGVKTRGIDPRTVSQVSNIDDYLILGDLKQLDSEGVIVGKELARFLGLGLGSKLSLQVDPRKVHNFTVKGIFSSGMYEYDTELVFLHLNKAKEMLGLSNISGIAVKLNNLDEAVRVKEKIRNLLGYSYFIRTWTELNANFFAALKLEKVAMFVILCLIVLVAAFNIISTLIVMVVQKTKDIGILKALGMSRQRIRGIFTYEGLVIGFIGTGLGIAFGWLLCVLLEKYQFIKLPADIYYLDHLPVSLALWPDLSLIIIAALIITVLSTIYPALRAGRLDPVEALRYE
ncbi:MAG: FtsX-like permease family protein [Candidatus Omnitrophota bacterium]